jgi:hypothetical protein
LSVIRLVYVRISNQRLGKLTQESMKILFLDIDGVVNGDATLRRNRRLIDPQLAALVRGILSAVPGLLVVLSSSWRYSAKGRNVIERRVAPSHDVTPILHDITLERGHEIEAWLVEHPGVERYAILDDDPAMLPHQLPNFFQTSSESGITEEIANRVVAHFSVTPL